MATGRAVKKGLYNFMSRFYRGHLILLVSILAINLGLIIFVEKAWIDNVIMIAAVASVSFLTASYLIATGITIWGWHFLTFRYLAYWLSRAFSLIMPICKHRLFRGILVLILSAAVWEGWQVVDPGRWNYKFLKNMLMPFTVIKILLVALVISVIWQMFRYRKKLIISDFGNFSGDKELEPVIQGISTRILNEMNRLANLLNTIDDIQPDNMLKETFINSLTMDVQDLGKELEEIIGTSSTINIAKIINVPLKPLYVFFRRKSHGPLLVGSIHAKGKKITMSACLKGGEYNCSWQINADDIDEPFESNAQLIVQMTNQLTFRIFAYIFREKSPKWETMKHYTNGLRIFRETIRTKENKTLNLIKAKNEFYMAIRKDNRFTQCYYNLGIINIELGNEKAAISAFREAIKKEPGYCHCYYRLAYLHYKLNDFNNAQWFCEEAINICPTNSEYWNLWGAIHYYRWEKKDLPDSGNENNSGNIQELRKWFNEKKSIPDQAIYPIIVGAAQAWKKLCRSIVMGEKIEKQIVIAVTNIRNHAVLNGKMKKFTTGRLFGQALSISPDDDELYFEQGKYFFKREKWKKANKAFRRVYEDAWEISESFSYWAMYIHTNGKLLKDLKERKCPGNKDRKRCLKCKWSYECEKYTNVIKDDYRLFLGAAANHIHRMGDEGVEDKKKSAEFTLYGSFVENAFALEKIDYKHQDVEDFLKKNKEGKKIKKILSKKELKTLKRNLIEDRSGIEDAVKDSNDLFENIPAFKSWLEAQKAIAYALWILKENEKRSKKELKDAKKLLTDAIIILEKLGLSESRILRLQRHLAKLNLKLGDYPEALTAAREAARNNPFDEDVRHVLADIYILMKDYSRGIDELEASFNLGNSTPEMLKKIGDARCENGKRLFQPEKRKKEFQGAIKDYNQCLKMLMDKSQKESFLNEQEKNGKSSGADSYTEFIEDAYYEMGSTYIRLAKYDEARNHFQFAFKIAKILKHRKKKLKIRTQITKLYAKAKVQQLKKTGPVR